MEYILINCQKLNWWHTVVARNNSFLFYSAKIRQRINLQREWNKKKTVAAAATMYAEKVISNKDEQANRSSLDTKTFIQSNLGCMFTKLFFFHVSVMLDSWCLSHFSLHLCWLHADQNNFMNQLIYWPVEGEKRNRMNVFHLAHKQKTGHIW